MLARLRHRGPDDEGTYLSPDGRLCLAHARLSILDLSRAGRQPMTNEDGTLWVTYNGEVYNFQELREELTAKGHRFSSRTDSEVILHLYEEKGEACVQHLRGMFAFALYDQARQRLFLARDRLGIKPLYYAERGGAFLFASEIKAILASGLIPPEPDWQAVSDYFTFHFVPHPQTAFREIRQLPPAHTLTLDLKNSHVATQRYWSPLPGPPAMPIPYPEARARVRHLLAESVREEMVSDVPLGLFFSGGIDSTLLAALMARHSSQPVKTFTVVFQGDPGDAPWGDLECARLASRAIGTEHHELPVRLSSPEEFLNAVELVDQPFANPTLYIQHLIARATRQEVTVALSGVGGDEMFGGYPKYRLLPAAPLLSAIPAAWGRAARGALGAVPERWAEPWLRRAKRLLRGVGFGLADQYMRWAYSLTEEEKGRLFSGPLSKEPLLPAGRVVKNILSGVPSGTDRYGQVFAAELETFLCDNLLEYTDRATMAVALETRVPFLDHRLVELAARIPFHDKIRHGRTKVVLVDAFREMIPKPVLKSPKRGFSPPIARWMEQVLDLYFERTLTRPVVEKEGIFRWDGLQALRASHKQGIKDQSLELVSVLMFDIWHRRYVLGQP